ncbi:MAG TPA: P-loop NTPase fold protein [Candidatus Saccharimonadales bacterium]|nr:P-loop NTPase fold protein [Candidatus Saccharimonadales bacterium]
MFSETPKKIATKISELAQSKEPFFVAIDGHGGSGKSSFSRDLLTELTENGKKASLVELDGFPDKTTTKALVSRPDVKSYYKIDIRRIIDTLLKPLLSDNEVTYQIEDWWSDRKEQKTVKPDGIIIIEGCYSLSSELREFYDYKIFIECSPSLCLKRASDRDIAGGGDPITAPLLWKEIYFPNEEAYMKKEDPISVADIIIKSE